MTRKPKHLTGQKLFRRAAGAVKALASPRRRGRGTGAGGKPLVETLEGRQLMASVTLAADGLRVYGDSNAANLISVRLQSNKSTVALNVNGKVSYHALDQVRSLRLTGGKKQDVIFVDPRIDKPMHVRSGAGRDSVYAEPGHGRRGDKADLVLHPSKGDAAVAALEKQAIARRKAEAPSPKAPRITGFSLVNADTDRVIAKYESLGDGVTLNLATLPTRRLNIVANVAGDTDGSVRFSLNGGLVGTENSAPYALYSNNGSDLYAWTPAVGTYTLAATPFSKDHALGLKGAGKTITFKVVNQRPPSSGSGGGGGDVADPVTDPAPPPAPEPVPGPVPGGNDDDGGTDNAASPTAVIDAITTRVQAGHAIHVNALKSALRVGDPLHARYEWNFGDPKGKYDTLVGFNAAHFYERPGTYTITLTVTNAAGKTSVAKTTVTVEKSTRRVIYVSRDGNDWNTGFAPDDAVRSWSRAMSMVGNDTEIRFRRGDRWDVTETVNIGRRNLVIGAYGTGARPVLRWTAAIDGGSTILSTAGGTDVTVRDLAFDSTADNGKGLFAIRVGGTNVAVVGSEFRTVGYALNNNGKPRGLLAQDNVATDNGLASYFAWVEGSDHVYLGNRAHLNTDRGHVVRVGGADRVLLAHNAFSKLANDEGVTIRGTLTLHVGSYVYAAGNTLTNGKVTTGPLANYDGEGDPLEPEDRIKWVVLEGNTINSVVILEHGTSQVMVRNNVINRDKAAAIEVEGESGAFDRRVNDVYILNNTAVTDSTSGNFLKVYGEVGGITMNGNLYVAPNLVTGELGSAAVYVVDTDLSSFRSISGNVWPDATTLGYARGGINYVGTEYNSDGHVTASDWEAYQAVVGDVFEDVGLSTSYRITIDGTTAGAALKRAA